MLDDRQKSIFRESFYRVVNALERAEHWELPRTIAMLQRRLVSMGGWQDETGCWDYDTRPIKPIDDEAGADMSAGWEV